MSLNIPIVSIPKSSKMHQQKNFWSAKIPSGNLGWMPLTKLTKLG
jgi:hypothetical protein